ncbi:hypothetical protein KSP39_PZI014570 [Platanthera zijinensis]|uniref:Uncharacterized protein n=1 Tax=Platanthera zijinensis TaxID=2320716 RepID=A0AAP0BA26_9ASPA
MEGLLFLFSPPGYPLKAASGTHVNLTVELCFLMFGCRLFLSKQERIEEENKPMEMVEMASPSSSHVDEDDFDWEAAVREIDSACETTIPSTSYGGTSVDIAGGACPRPVLPLCRARQSTLDSFVSTKAKQKDEDKFCTESDFQDPVAGDIWVRNNPSKPGDGPPAVSIDPEAAKNWIYPGILSALFPFNLARAV